jgi:hypothetical protein
MQNLAKNNIVVSHRGVNGGFGSCSCSWDFGDFNMLLASGGVCAKVNVIV